MPEPIQIRDYHPGSIGHLHDKACVHRLLAFPPRRRRMNTLTQDQVMAYWQQFVAICEADGVRRTPKVVVPNSNLSSKSVATISQE